MEEEKKSKDHTAEIDKFMKSYLALIILLFVFGLYILALSEDLAKINSRNAASAFTKKRYDIVIVPNEKADAAFFSLAIDNLAFDIDEEKEAMNITLYMQRTDWIKEIRVTSSDPQEKVMAMRAIHHFRGWPLAELNYYEDCNIYVPNQRNFTCNFEKLGLPAFANITIDMKSSAKPHGEYSIYIKGENMNISTIEQFDFLIRTRAFKCVSTYCFPQKEGVDFEYILDENRTIYHVSSQNRSNTQPIVSFTMNSENQKLSEEKNKDIANVLTMIGISGGGLIAIFIELLKAFRRRR